MDIRVCEKAYSQSSPASQLCKSNVQKFTRQATSNRCRPFWWRVRCPQPQSATGLTTASKKIQQVFQRHIPVTQGCFVSTKNFGNNLQMVGDVQSRPSSFPDTDDASKHLCAPDRFFICDFICICVRKCDGGWVCAKSKISFAARYRTTYCNAMIWAVWMLHVADFSDQWWGLFAYGPGITMA